MNWFGWSISHFPARCARPELVSGLPVGLYYWAHSTVRLIVDYFQDVRGSVKGKQNDLFGEGVQMCVGVVVGLVGRGAAVWWCVSTRITFRGWFTSNVAETRAFYNADFFSGSGSSTEPVVPTRATHNGVNHGERRVGVKLNLISLRCRFVA
ncbi:hypothetical protein [uncultured Gimesia sp.]|uniref:hypothetical protein n=1 Tax=uncultured Gimesia sp. TaxID=1678688 RepID=UPI0030DD3254